MKKTKYTKKHERIKKNVQKNVIKTKYTKNVKRFKNVQKSVKKHKIHKNKRKKKKSYTKNKS